MTGSRIWLNYGSNLSTSYSWTNSALTVPTLEVQNYTGTVDTQYPTLTLHHYGYGGPRLGSKQGVLYIYGGDTNAKGLGSQNSYFKEMRIYPNTAGALYVNDKQVITSGNISSQSVNYATSAGSANSVAWGNVTGKPSTFAPSSHNHDGRYSYAHQSSFAFNATHDSNYVTFDQSNPAGSPGSNWYNGFVSTHNNYLSSYIINAHRTANWYVGYSENTTAPTWYTLIHSGNIGSQSVNYANSAGSVSWTNVSMANRDVTLTNSEGRAQVHISKSYAIFGYNNCDGGLSTYVDGRQIYFRVGSNWTTAVTINSSAQTTFSGNVSTGSYSITTGGVSASGTSNRLIFRHLDGQNCNGDYNLYLQYHQSNAVTYFNGGTYYIKGGYYNGTAAAANSVAWSNVTSKPGASGNVTTPVYWNGSGFTNCTAYGSASVNYANSAGSLSGIQFLSGTMTVHSDGSHSFAYLPMAVEDAQKVLSFQFWTSNGVTSDYAWRYFTGLYRNDVASMLVGYVNKTISLYGKNVSNCWIACFYGCPNPGTVYYKIITQ